MHPKPAYAFFTYRNPLGEGYIKSQFILLAIEYQLFIIRPRLQPDFINNLWGHSQAIISNYYFTIFLRVNVNKANFTFCGISIVRVFNKLNYGYIFTSN
jgi:hypothetical protein